MGQKLTESSNSSELLTSNFGQGNGSGENYFWPLRDPLPVVIPITVIYILILVTGLLGNVITCVVIIRSRYLHTTTNYYLFSLAISDLLLLLSGLPAEMHSIWRRYPDVFGESFCFLRGLASETSANATVLTITAFTIERYLAICHPFMHQKYQNKLSRVVRQILVIWIISTLLAIPQVRNLFTTVSISGKFSLLKPPPDTSFNHLFLVIPIILSKLGKVARSTKRQD